jgi:hypothetical protein
MTLVYRHYGTTTTATATTSTLKQGAVCTLSQLGAYSSSAFSSIARILCTRNRDTWRPILAFYPIIYQNPSNWFYNKPYDTQYARMDLGVTQYYNSTQDTIRFCTHSRDTRVGDNESESSGKNSIMSHFTVPSLTILTYRLTTPQSTSLILYSHHTILTLLNQDFISARLLIC